MLTRYFALACLLLSSTSLVTTTKTLSLCVIEFPTLVRSPSACKNTTCSINKNRTRSFDLLGAQEVYVGPIGHLAESAPHIDISVQAFTVPREIEIADYVKAGICNFGFPINSAFLVMDADAYRRTEFISRKSFILWLPSQAIGPVSIVFSSMASTWPYVLSLMIGCLSVGIIVPLADSGNSDWKVHGLYHGWLERTLYGFWWSFISATTVGYGDKAPKSLESRILAIFWIICGLVVVTMMVGTFIGDLDNFSAFSSLDWIHYSKNTVGVRANTSSYAYAFANGVPLIMYDSYYNLCIGLQNKEVDAAMLDQDWANSCLQELPDTYETGTTTIEEKYWVISDDVVDSFQGGIDLLEFLSYIGRHPSREATGATAHRPGMGPIKPPIAAPFRLDSSHRLMASAALIAVSLGLASAIALLFRMVKHELVRRQPQQPVIHSWNFHFEDKNKGPPVPQNALAM